jgi:hypothetical protein
LLADADRVACGERPKRDDRDLRIDRNRAEKVRHYDEVLGGIARFDFQMSVAALPHGKLMEAMRLIGEKVKGMVNG